MTDEERELKRRDEEECRRQREAFHLSPEQATGILECLGFTESQRAAIGDAHAHRVWVEKLVDAWVSRHETFFGFSGTIDEFAQRLFKQQFPASDARLNRLCEEKGGSDD